MIEAFIIFYIVWWAGMIIIAYKCLSQPIPSVWSDKEYNFFTGREVKRK